MITVTNLAIQFGKRVLYKDVNLKSLTVTFMVLLVPTVPVSLPSFAPSARSGAQQGKRGIRTRRAPLGIGAGPLQI